MSLGRSGTTSPTEADDMASLRDAVRCHFDDDQRPDAIRLHFVRDEVIAA